MFMAIFNLSSSFCVYADTQQAKQVEAQRSQIRAQINRLQRLERQETNKLNKNQQKLENNQERLRKSQNLYSKKQENLVKLQKDLTYYLNQYNIRQKATADRIRFIYKTKHTLILDLLLT
jgi:septal ring factor EnvC (AmiA/AmiB activator)